MKRDDQSHIIFWNLYPGLWWLCEMKSKKKRKKEYHYYSRNSPELIVFTYEQFFWDNKIEMDLECGWVFGPKKKKRRVCYIINQSIFFSFRFIYKFLRFKLFSSKKTPTELFNQMEKWKNKVDSRLIISKEFLHAIVLTHESFQKVHYTSEVPIDL